MLGKLFLVAAGSILIASAAGAQHPGPIRRAPLTRQPVSRARYSQTRPLLSRRAPHPGPVRGRALSPVAAAPKTYIEYTIFNKNLGLAYPNPGYNLRDPFGGAGRGMDPYKYNFQPRYPWNTNIYKSSGGR